MSARLRAISDKVRHKALERELLSDSRDKLKADMEKFEAKSKILADAVDVAQTVSVTLQSQVKDKIVSVVQTGLDATFPGNGFAMDFVSRRDRTEVDMYVTDPGGNRQSILDGSGGGLKDIVSFLLRVSIWSMDRGTSDVILLDEPMKFMSAGHREEGASLLEVLSGDLGVQFLVVSHVQEIIDGADVVYKVTKNQDGMSSAKKVI